MSFAEIVASSTRSFEGEVYYEAELPDFGSWVEVEHANGTTLYGLVSHVEIGSLDPNRRIRAYGMDEGELRRERPQIPELMLKTCRGQWLAYRTKEGVVRQTLPPQPPPLHYPLAHCTPEAIRAIGAPYDFLRTLARNPDPEVPVDELLVASLTRIGEAQATEEQKEAALVEAARALSRLLNDDHERLHAVLRRAV